MNYRIKDVCDEKGIKVNSIAEKVGISLPALYNIVNGKMSPKVETLEKIASALNVPITDLFEKPSDEIVGAVRIGGDTHVINSKEDIKKLAENL